MVYELCKDLLDVETVQRLCTIGGIDVVRLTNAMNQHVRFVCKNKDGCIVGVCTCFCDGLNCIVMYLFVDKELAEPDTGKILLSMVSGAFKDCILTSHIVDGDLNRWLRSGNIKMEDVLLYVKN